MKRIALFLCLLLSFALMSWGQHSAKRTAQFVITGNIPGMKDGVKVKLINFENHNRQQPIATTVVRNHAFRLTGTVNSPMLCQLCIDDKAKLASKDDYMQESGTVMFVENVPMKVMAAHYDSIPKAYEFGTSPLLKERNVTVSGGNAQMGYNEYRQYIYSTDLAAWKADHACWLYQFGDGIKVNPDEKVMGPLQERASCAQQVLQAANDRFMACHPDYPISLLLCQKKLDNKFTNSNAEYDKWLCVFKDNKDVARYRQFVSQVAAARKYAKGQHYTDFTVQTTDSTQKKLSDYVNSKEYTLIDFWASWCGPCRASIPHVKALNEQYGSTKLGIISISCDKKVPDWKRAMDEEKMPWQQLLLPQQSFKLVAEAYSLSGIPYLLLVNAKGEIVYSSNSSDEMTAFLKKLFK